MELGVIQQLYGQNFAYEAQTSWPSFLFNKAHCIFYTAMTFHGRDTSLFKY